MGCLSGKGSCRINVELSDNGRKLETPKRYVVWSTNFLSWVLAIIKREVDMNELRSIRYA